MSISVNHITKKLQGNAVSRQWMLFLLLFIQLPAFASTLLEKDQKTYVFDYVMSIKRSALAIVDSNLVVSLQLTAIQDVPVRQSVILAPVLEDTTSLRNVELPLICLLYTSPSPRDRG